MKMFLTTLILLILSFTNSYSQWLPTNGPGGGSMTCIASNGNDLYAGSSLGGIYFSENKGENWQSIGTPLTNTKAIRNFAFKGDNIFVATSAGVIFSSDKGKNWELRNNGLTNLYLTDIIVNNDNLICATIVGIFISSDFGNSWVLKNTGLDPRSIGAVCLASKDDVLYAGFSNASIMGNIIGGGVYKSTNMGDNWFQIGLDTITVQDLKISGDTIFAATRSGFYFSSDNGTTWLSKSIGINESLYSFAYSDNYYYVGSYSGIFVSSNYGNNWTKSNFTNLLIPSLAEINGEIYAATGEGTFSTDDNGINWKKQINGIITTHVFDLISFNNKIFAGTYQNGLAVTNNRGDIWEIVDIGLLEKSISELIVYNDTIFAIVYSKGKILKSIDKGLSWTALNMNVYYLSNLIVSGNNYIISSANGVFVSTDVGQTWSSIESPRLSSFKKVDNKIYAASNKGLLVSVDDGLNWNFTPTDLQDTLMHLTCLEIQGNTFYSFDYKKGFVKSTDLGKTWIRPQIENLPDSTVTGLEIYGSNIFLSSTEGIYLSTDDGENWNQVNEGLSNTYILKIFISDDYIYAGTAGAGVFKAKLSDFGIINSVENKIEDRNYLYANPPFPLPATNEVRSLIYWDTSTEIDIEQIAVYNIYGAKVAGHDKIRLDKLNAYSGNLVWDCSGVESGIYVIHLMHGTESRIIKVIVTK